MPHRIIWLAVGFASILSLVPLRLSAPAMHAEGGCAGTVRSFVDAVDNGDAAAALQDISPNLTVSLPNGLTLPLGRLAASLPSAQASVLPASFLPLTIVSLSADSQAADTVDAVLTIGSQPTAQQAQITCSNGLIASIAVSGDAAS